MPPNPAVTGNWPDIPIQLQGSVQRLQPVLVPLTSQANGPRPAGAAAAAAARHSIVTTAAAAARHSIVTAAAAAARSTASTVAEAEAEVEALVAGAEAVGAALQLQFVGALAAIEAEFAAARAEFAAAMAAIVPARKRLHDLQKEQQQQHCYSSRDISLPPQMLRTLTSSVPSRFHLLSQQDPQAVRATSAPLEAPVGPVHAEQTEGPLSLAAGAAAAGVVAGAAPSAAGATARPIAAANQHASVQEVRLPQ